MAAIVKWVIGAVVGVVIVIVTFISVDPKLKNPTVNPNSISSVVEDQVAVTIEGQVAHPATYTLDENLTILDLVNLAGGY